MHPRTTGPRLQSVAPNRTEGARWRAIEGRDRRADGTFVYGVRTTGVFCRPSCASRRPLRANVETFDSARAAAHAGYRACLRCHPDRDDAVAPPALLEACRLFSGETPPRCEEVASALGMSASALSRLFRAHLGVTPRAYRGRVLAERAKRELGPARSVTDAVYGAGYAAPSRFYASAGAELGMTPARARRGGAGEAVAYVVRRCALGRVLVAWTAKGVCEVALGDDDDALASALTKRFPRAALARASAPPWLRDVLAAVDGDASSAGRVPLDLRGTAFQEKVWQALRTIARGETRTYEALAAELDAPLATRAVARACATNAVAVLVPCHRVVRKDGALAGYRWGVERKRALLAREAAAKTDRVARRRPA